MLTGDDFFRIGAILTEMGKTNHDKEMEELAALGKIIDGNINNLKFNFYVRVRDFPTLGMSDIRDLVDSYVKNYEKVGKKGGFRGSVALACIGESDPCGRCRDLPKYEFVFSFTPGAIK